MGSVGMALWTVILLAVALAWRALWTLRVRPYWLAPLPEGRSPDAPLPSLSVIIPARNEERNLPGLLERLAREGSATTEILVVDDHSTDGTAECARQAMQADPRVQLIASPERPAGWAGKTWALTQGAAAATGDWLVLCDADILLGKDTLAQAWDLIRAERLDGLSLVPRMQNRRQPVALLLGCFALARAVLFRPAAPGRRGLIQGAFLVLRRAAYTAVGGHASLSGSLLEDVELGYLLQDAGFRVAAYPAHGLLATRMYGSFRTAWQGMTKHLFACLDYSLAKAAGSLLLHLALLPLPLLSLLVLLARTGAGGATAGLLFALTGALAAVVAMYGVGLAVTRRERLPLAAGLLLPMSILLLAGVLLDSAYGYRRGAIVWKGRSYAARAEARRDAPEPAPGPGKA